MSTARKPTPQSRVDTLDLDEGLLILQWPPNISVGSVREARQWLDMEVKRMESQANRPIEFDPKKEFKRPVCARHCKWPCSSCGITHYGGCKCPECAPHLHLKPSTEPQP